MNGARSVLHVVVAGELGGAERVLVDLASRPTETGASHAVALFTPLAALGRLLEDAGLRVLRPPSPSGDGAAAHLRRSLGARDVSWLAGVIARERAGAVHLHTFGSQVLGTRAALRAGVRVVRTEHSTRVFDDPTCWPMARWSLRRADACVAVSEHVASRARARAPWAAGRLRVVRNGVDIDRFAPPAKAPPRAGPLTFALVGRLEPRKGIDLALLALARTPGTRLDVVGDGPSRAALEMAARAAGLGGRAVFHGSLADPRPVVARAHAALCASRTEGLGIALLEAMAMGRPVVGFAVGGVPEIVEDGRTGLLAPPGDVEALAARMRDAAREPDRLGALGAAARATVVARHSSRAMRAAYAEVYASMA
ncbi:MAG: glycosyltransferase family 4 protein [Myxococcales bacterium]|nr:glycosyltransferase family 4 protein [Myxococcales bacterium]